MTFTFKTVPHVHFETGSAAKLGALLKGRMSRPVIVTDKGVVACGLLDGALKSLEAENLDYLVIDSIEADPPARMVRVAVAEAQKHKADGVIGFGGGSSMDTAKVIACLLSGAQSLEEIYGTNNVTAPRAPLALLPTTAGTGSEVTDISIITSDEDLKTGVVADQLFADIAIVDPALTLSAPRHVTNATGIDAMVHAIEAYTSIIRKNPVSDALAREALKLLSSNIQRACDAPDDIKAREAMALGALLAGQAFANAPCALVHAMAYPLGALFHVPHGLSNSLMLAPVLRFNMGEAARLYAELGDVIGADGTGDYKARAEAFVAKMLQICASTGVQQRLSEVGVSHNDLPRMAEDVMKIERLLQNNPRRPTYEDALALYTEVL